MNTKEDIIIGFCWYLHFLVEKQGKDPEVLRCGQKPDVIRPLEILPGVQWQRQDRELEKTEATGLAQYKRCF